jgi:hypothetical protein
MSQCRSVVTASRPETGRHRVCWGMTEQDRSSAPAAPGGTGWGVRPHGSVGPRRLANVPTLAAVSRAPVTLVMSPATPTVIANAPPPSPGWRVRIRETPPAPPPPPAPAATAVPAPPAEGHLAARAVVAAVGATVLATVVVHLRGSAPGQQPVTTGGITTAPQKQAAPPPAGLSSAPPGSSTHLYRVVAGDSMWAIAVRYGVSLTDLARANPQVHNLGLIHIGDLLHLS